MTRNLKVLVLAAMALAALGAIGASGAQGAQFHCSVEPCSFTPELDGTAKNSHHVLIVKNKLGETGSLTCNQITGSGTNSTKTSETATLTGITYDCPVAKVTMNGCNYEFKASGLVSIVGCKAGKEIEVVENGCTVKIPEQNNHQKVTYNNVGTSPNRTVTVSTAVTLSVTSISATGCIIKDEPPFTGEYTTGNTLVRPAEDKAGGLHVDGWWE